MTTPPAVPEPGYYWARIADKMHANFPRPYPTPAEIAEIPWSVVKVSECDGGCKVWYPGCEEEMVVAEWGPRLEPPGLAAPDLTAAIMSASSAEISVSEPTLPGVSRPMTVATIDLAELERIARAADKDNPGVCYSADHVDGYPYAQSAMALFNAMDPATTMSLIRSIRELGQIATRALGEWRAWHAEVSTSDTEAWKATDAEIEALIHQHARRRPQRTDRVRGAGTMTVRYFSASICYDPQEGGWTYYVAALDETEARAALAGRHGFSERHAEWEEREADEVVTVDQDAGYDQITLGTLKPGEVRCFTW